MSTEKKDKNDNYTIFKKWGRGRFASFVVWPHGSKIVVDIGEFDTRTNKRTVAAKCFLDLDEFMAYLNAYVGGQESLAFPTMNTVDKHGVTYYGGTNIARVFKIEDWGFNPGDKETPASLRQSTARRFKCGEFHAVPGADGTRPDFKKPPLATASIQMTPEELFKLHANLTNFWTAITAARLLRGDYGPDEFKREDTPQL